MVSKFLSWAMHEGQRYATKLLYAPLPEELVTLNEGKIKTLK